MIVYHVLKNNISTASEISFSPCGTFYSVNVYIVLIQRTMQNFFFIL